MNNPRDNSASWVWHTRHVVNHECYADMYIDRAADDGDREDIAELRHAPAQLASCLVSRYARGDSVDELSERFVRWVRPRFESARALYQPFYPHSPLTLKFDKPSSWMMLMAMICFDEEGAMVTRPDDWFSSKRQPALYAMVLKGFVPGYRYADAYDSRHTASAHEQAVVDILLQPRDTWPGAFEAYLRQWPALMESEGYRDQPDDDRDPFHQFPLHVAAAVCAFDIGDATFAELPWYPRDLVAHYRTHVRHSRDAWRAADLEPANGLFVGVQSQKKKRYALSRSEAYTRWLELVSGSPERLKAARKALGRRKTMPALFDLMEALAGQGLAIQADFKDNETAEHQLLALCCNRGLPAPPLPDEPPQGPARVTALLYTLLAYATDHGLTMAALDDHDDSQNVVLVATPSLGEFELLCEQLGVGRLPDGAWY